MAFGGVETAKTLKKALKQHGKKFKAKQGEILVDGNKVFVWHFGTRILTVNTDGSNPELGGGFSYTDQTIINTVLSQLGSSKRASRKGGSMHII